MSDGTSNEAKSGSFWTTLPGILTGIAAIITAVGGLIAALAAAGVFDGDDGGSADPPDTVATTTISGSGGVTVPPTASPVAPATTGTVTLTYPDDGLGCQLFVQIDLGGTAFSPTGLRHVQTGVPLGDQSYAIGGQITCPTLGTCEASGSGVIGIADQRSYAVLWENTAIGFCDIWLE